MARVSGPAMSLDASGSLGGAIVFSKWKGRNYVRELVTPLNPKSAKQTGVRAMMKFLTQRWQYISAGSQDDWDAPAEASQISAINAYVRENLNRWQLFQGPSQIYPATEASSGLTVSSHTYTGGAGFATLSLTPSGSTSIWGFAIFRDAAEITAPNWNNCVAVIPANGASAVSYTDSPLTAGTYHYRACVLNTDGKMGTVLADDTCAVT
jgi:hypothetical protein